MVFLRHASVAKIIPWKHNLLLHFLYAFFDLGGIDALFPYCLQKACINYGTDKFVPLNVYVYIYMFYSKEDLHRS